MVVELFAYITCQCGTKVQVLNADGTDWDQPATEAAFQEHYATCPTNPDYVPAAPADQTVDQPADTTAPTQP